MVEHHSAFPLHPQSGDRNSALHASLARRFTREQLRAGAIVVLAVLWPWLGLFGREPWKPDEAYTFGLVWSMLEGKGLVVPLLAGEPFLEKPPLFYWVAAGLARAFSGALPLHEGARLAIPLFTYVTLGCLIATARELYGKKRCMLVAVLFIGALGIFDKLHLLVTDVALVAGMSMALLGFALGRRRPVAGGIVLGLGAGIAFLSKGLLGPGVLASTLVLLAFFRSWRGLWNRRLLVAAVVAALPFLLLWPLALYTESPRLFSIWLWNNNVGRFFGLVRLGQAHGAWFYPLTLLWFGFPLWVFAMRPVATAIRDREASTAVALPLATLGAMLAVLMSAHQSRALYALPMMLPVALLALPAFDRAPSERLAWLQRGSRSLFVAAAGLLWVLWLSAVSGFPDATGIFLAEREPGFVPAFAPAAFASAALLTMLFWLIARDSRPTPVNALCTWAAGLATVWGLLTTLWLPYLDYGMAYRSVAASLRQALPPDASCVASTGLGEPQRAMLDYYANLITRRVEADPAARECAWMIVQQLGAGVRRPDAGWEVVWSGSRPGDTRERLTLLHRERSG